MPIKTEKGIVEEYDAATQIGTYKIPNEDKIREFDTVRPIREIQPGKAIVIMTETPRGKKCEIAVECEGSPC